MSTSAIHPIHPQSDASGALTAGALRDTQTFLSSASSVEELGIVGQSAPAERLRLQLRRIGPHFRTVLLTGGPGTEKEPVARALHSLSPRASGPFIARHATVLDHIALSDSGTLPSLMDAVNAGTLYLDGLTEISPLVQDRLLQTLRQQELRSPGGASNSSLCLIVAATEDLRAMASSGLFRQELYQRLAMVEITLPPLRARSADIPDYVSRWLQRTDMHFGRRIERVSYEVLEQLCRHDWPGDVVELENVLNNSALRGVGFTVSLEDLPPLASSATNQHHALTVSTKLQDVIDQHVLQVLRNCGGNKLRTAEILGISRSTLYRMLDALSTSRQVL